MMNNQLRWSFFPLERKTHSIHYIISEERQLEKFDYNFVLYLSRLCNNNIVTNDPYWDGKLSNVKYDKDLDIHSLLDARKTDVTLLLNFDLLVGDSINPVLALDWAIKTRILELFNTGIMGQTESICHIVSYGKYKNNLSYYYNKMNQIFIDQTNTLRDFTATYYSWKSLKLFIALGEDILYHMNCQGIEVKVETLDKKTLPILH